MSRQSNLERAKWRNKCREALSQHINDGLGLEINPQQVRLLPHEDDLYTWDVSENKRHLFKKHLSKLSTGPLMELCREVGLSFRAIRQQRTDSESENALPCQVQEQNAALKEELDLARQRVDLAEKRLERLAQAFRMLKRRNEVTANFILRHRAHMIDYIRESRCMKHY
ncbi:hypothetical protein CDEST_14396 [Colletotrichum destructivum]|uniref:Uncharacterized protein n=1 Tax=Colletotrichum destructivum TaxID=34406 RepID=A0AAX4J1S8_9PEZI|nr:hypothetical protein CDEST_14396 [Colletotrichum destructivum]